LLLLVTLLFAALVGACSKASATKRSAGGEQLRLRYQAYPTLVGYPELAADLGYLAPVELEYVGSTISGPQNIQAVATGDVDFGGAFNGAIVKLAARKANLKAVIAYYGTDDESCIGFYTLPGSSIQSAKDLLGKKVAVNTIGAHAEFTIREYLSRQGLSAEQARQVQMVVLPPGTAEQALREGQVDVAGMQTILYEKAKPRGDLRLLFSDRALFGNFNAGSLVMRTRFIEENPNTVRKFVQATAKAIEWARTRPREEVIARLEKVMKKRGANEDVSQLSHWRSTTIVTPGGRMTPSDFQRWTDWLVRDGQLASGQIDVRTLYSNDFQEGGALSRSAN
jgi:ABC-type nitrate/sulfonate/bicarbonate transport system substrate-binding protein